MDDHDDDLELDTVIELRRQTDLLESMDHRLHHLLRLQIFLAVVGVGCAAVPGVAIALTSH